MNRREDKENFGTNLGRNDQMFLYTCPDAWSVFLRTELSQAANIIWGARWFPCRRASLIQVAGMHYDLLHRVGKTPNHDQFEMMPYLPSPNSS